MAKKKRKIPRWLHGPLFLAIRTAMLPLGVFDLAESVAVARAAARTYAGAKINRKRLKRATDNLLVAFPDWDDERRREYAIKSYEHLFTLGVEAAVMPRLLNDDGWSSHVALGDMQTSVRELLSRGYPATPSHPDAPAHPRRACSLITGHTGNWELLGYTMALLGFPMHALFRPLDVAPMDRWLRRTRESRGLVLVDKFGATESLPRLLGEGYPVGFVADQNGGDRGLFVPFFDRLASAYKSIGLLAVKYNTPIICGQARRLTHTPSQREGAGGRVLFTPHPRGRGPAGGFSSHPLPEGGGRGEGSLHAPNSNHPSPRPSHSVGFAEFQGEPMRYQIDVPDVIHPDDWADQPDPVFYITARYRRAIETMVRRAPEQYLWMHRYWKSRPRHEHQGKPIPRQLREKLERLPWMTQDQMNRIVEWDRRDAAALAQSDAAFR